MLDLPRNEFFFWKSGTAHDLILFLGVEPNLDWPAYAQAILDVALKNIITLAGFDIDLSDLREAGETLVDMMDKAFSQDAKALAQLNKLEEMFDADLGEEPLQGPGEDYAQAFWMRCEN